MAGKSWQGYRRFGVDRLGGGHPYAAISTDLRAALQKRIG
jgi:hypothetical protein